MKSVKRQLSLLGVVATVALVFAGAAEAGKLTLFVDVDEGSFDGPAAGVAGPFIERTPRPAPIRSTRRPATARPATVPEHSR